MTAVWGEEVFSPPAEFLLQRLLCLTEINVIILTNFKVCVSISDITVLTKMYVVFNMGIINYGVLQFKLRYVIQEIYLFLLHTFQVRISSTGLH